MSFTELNGNDEALSISVKRGRQQEHPIRSRFDSQPVDCVRVTGSAPQMAERSPVVATVGLLVGKKGARPKPSYKWCQLQGNEFRR